MIKLACNAEFKIRNPIIEWEDQSEKIGHNSIGFIGTLGILALGILPCNLIKLHLVET